MGAPSSSTSGVSSPSPSHCDGQQIAESFSPPAPIDDDGTFAVSFSDAGRKFQVRGTFTDPNHVAGTIDDKNDRCDATFEASHGAGPTRTPTPGITPTAHPIVPTETPTGGVSPSVTAT